MKFFLFGLGTHVVSKVTKQGILAIVRSERAGITYT